MSKGRGDGPDGGAVRRRGWKRGGGRRSEQHEAEEGAWREGATPAIPTGLLETVAMNSVFAVSPKSLSDILFKDSSPFHDQLHQARETREFEMSSWKNLKSEGGDLTTNICEKTVTFLAKGRGVLPAWFRVTEHQKLYSCEKTNTFVLETTVSTPTVPYGKSFTTLLRYELLPYFSNDDNDHDSLMDRTQLRASYVINFDTTMNGLMKRLVSAGTRAGMNGNFKHFKNILETYADVVISEVDESKLTPRTSAAVLRRSHTLGDKLKVQAKGAAEILDSFLQSVGFPPTTLGLLEGGAMDVTQRLCDTDFGRALIALLGIQLAALLFSFVSRLQEGLPPPPRTNDTAWETHQSSPLSAAVEYVLYKVDVPKNLTQIILAIVISRLCTGLVHAGIMSMACAFQNQERTAALRDTLSSMWQGIAFIIHQLSMFGTFLFHCLLTSLSMTLHPKTIKSVKSAQGKKSNLMENENGICTNHGGAEKIDDSIGQVQQDRMVMECLSINDIIPMGSLNERNPLGKEPDIFEQIDSHYYYDGIGHPADIRVIPENTKKRGRAANRAKPVLRRKSLSSSPSRTYRTKIDKANSHIVKDEDENTLPDSDYTNDKPGLQFDSSGDAEGSDSPGTKNTSPVGNHRKRRQRRQGRTLTQSSRRIRLLCDDVFNGNDAVIVECFQNERKLLFHGFNGPLLPTDGVKRWSNREVSHTCSNFEDIDPILPGGWYWDSPWMIDFTGVDDFCVDDEGWAYGTNMSQLNASFNPGQGKKRWNSFVRKRRWYRTRRRMSTQMYEHELEMETYRRNQSKSLSLEYASCLTRRQSEILGRERMSRRGLNKYFPMSFGEYDAPSSEVLQTNVYETRYASHDTLFSHCVWNFSSNRNIKEDIVIVQPFRFDLVQRIKSTISSPIICQNNCMPNNESEIDAENRYVTVSLTPVAGGEVKVTFYLPSQDSYIQVERLAT